MKKIKYNANTNYLFSEKPGGYSADTIVSRANSIGSELARMLQEYEKLQIEYSKLQSATQFKRLEQYELQKLYLNHNKNTSILFDLSVEKLNEIYLKDQELDAVNKAIAESNVETFENAKKFLTTLGFKEQVGKSVRSKMVWSDAEWLVQLKDMKNQFNGSFVVEARVFYNYVVSLRASEKERISKVAAEQSMKENEAKLVAEQALKAKREILLIAKTCLQYGWDTDEITSVEQLDRKLISIGEIPEHVKKAMFNEL